MDATVSALWIYPVKSCRGLALDRSAIEARGLLNDRRWMIVDGESTFVTQRTEPRLACIEVAMESDALVLRAPDRRDLHELRLPATARAHRPAQPFRRVKVWGDEVDAHDCGDEARDWVSRCLGFPASVVFMPDEVRRPVKPRYALASDIVAFADFFPLLVASTSSLDDLNARMELALPMARFRPNIVVSGCAPWAEDTWKRIRIGDVAIRIVKPSDRCVVTTTDQRTGERGLEPLRTLATFRRANGKVFFAQNAIPDGPGAIAVGEPVTVLEDGATLPLDGPQCR